MNLLSRLRRVVEFDLQKSWEVGKASLIEHKVHPAHHDACASRMAWWAAHSRGQEHENARLSPLWPAVEGVVEALASLIAKMDETDRTSSNLQWIAKVTVEKEKQRQALARLEAAVKELEQKGGGE